MQLAISEVHVTFSKFYVTEIHKIYQIASSL